MQWVIDIQMHYINSNGFLFGWSQAWVVWWHCVPTLVQLGSWFQTDLPLAAFPLSKRGFRKWNCLLPFDATLFFLPHCVVPIPYIVGLHNFHQFLKIEEFKIVEMSHLLVPRLNSDVSSMPLHCVVMVEGATIKVLGHANPIYKKVPRFFAQLPRWMVMCFVWWRNV